MAAGNVKTRVLIAGCGDLGQAVAARLDHSLFEIYGLRRSGQQLSGSVDTLQADVTEPASLAVLQDLSPAILLYCVAADAQTDDSYKAHYVDGLRNVLAALKHGPLQHVFFVSSTRVYGQKSDALLDESVVPVPEDFGAKRLLEAERLLESLDCGTTILRLSGIYGPGRTRMIRLAKTPRHWPAENTWTNRIHRDDAAGFIACMIEHAAIKEPVDRCYIVTDSQPVLQYEVLVWLANQFGMDTSGMRVPPSRDGKRLDNRRMLATGFKLAYPDYRAGYKRLIDTERFQD